MPDQTTLITAQVSQPHRLIKFAFALLLSAGFITALLLLFFTEKGHEILDDPHHFGRQVQTWVAEHPVSAPGIYLAIYITLGVLLLPVWWLQILCGYGFGLYFGTFWSLCGATIGAAISVAISRWFAADWFHSKVEDRVAKLHAVMETLGHNGLLLVLAIRLVHFVPFGLSNYALGLTRVHVIEVILGTFFGAIPAVAFYVGAGAQYHPWSNARFMAALAGINVLLLIPVAVRYLRPQWFKKIGVE